MKKSELRRKQSKLLIEHILNKDPISANSIFQKLIMEAEEDRENDVMGELGLDDDNSDTDDNDVDSDMEFGMDSTDSVEGLGSEETDKKVDDIIEINCQINAKLISNLFDKIADLKTQIEGLGLDPNSREYLKYDVTIQYYSDKLQDLQNKTNPGIDQSKVEEALDKITTAIEQLHGEVGGDSFDDQGNQDITDIKSPEEVGAENELNDNEEGDSEDSEETSEEDLEEEPKAEDSEKTSEEPEESEEGEEKEEKSDEDKELDNIFG